MSLDITNVSARFEAHFGAASSVLAHAPGRVNIIGEHTDYNGGFVLPMAIERETVILARPRADRMVTACAANLNRTAQCSLNNLTRNPEEPWMDYVAGVAREVAKLNKPLSGADILIQGDVPVGAGLSSSASLEMAALALFETMGGFSLEGAEAAKLGQRVENEFLGLRTGIMDQFIVRLGKKDHALFLDCRNLQYELAPMAFHDAAFVIANTGVARGLAASKYNKRVSECDGALTAINTVLGLGAASLRDCTIDHLEECRAQIDDVHFRRARHVITECRRTRDARDAMRRGDLQELGRLMNQSDWSLQKDYEVSCPELAIMTSIAQSLPGCYGSRMTGAGFGGCTVSLVSRDKLDEFREALGREYTAKTGIASEIIVSGAADGASGSVL